MFLPLIKTFKKMYRIVFEKIKRQIIKYHKITVFHNSRTRPIKILQKKSDDRKWNTTRYPDKNS
jgi:hypothetical protein